MSIFKFNDPQSPPRRSILQSSPTSPFCTSPSQLQDVTLDPDGTFPYTLGLHSPSGIMRGRSVKEFEETLTNLRKENFNLKLRIYFLEERMGANFNLDKENAIKKNIELKVEVESLRKELLEKQELLCQAVKAMELEEDEHKKDATEKDNVITDLQTQLETLQQKYDMFQDEIRCQGDHGSEDEHAQMYALRKSESYEMMIKELENKVRDLETQLSKEKSTVRELDNLLQLAETKNCRLSLLEAELKQKDETIKKLFAELEDRGKGLVDYNFRLESLNEKLLEKKNDIDYLKKDLKEKCRQLQDIQGETEEFQKLLSDTQTLYEMEKRKVDKHKAAILQRNNKIMELENLTEKQRTKIITLEARLESAHNEVQRKNHDPQILTSPLRKAKTNNTDVGSFLVCNAPASAELSSTKTVPKLKSPSNSSHKSVNSSTSSNLDENLSAANTSGKTLLQLQSDLAKSKKHIFKLEQDQLKACKIIESMLDTRKKNTKEIEELKGLLQTKDSQLEQYTSGQKREQNVKETKSLQAKITELNLTATVNPTADSETPVTDPPEDPKILLEQYKELTDNLEEQKQVLVFTLEETKSQMHEFETKHALMQNELKQKENRIVDLEFELLTLSQGIDNSMGEKSDTGNEKPSNFFLGEIEEKDKEIERLENELRKRNCDLQGIVNKELWEKNREIEKLQKRYGDIIGGKDQEITRLTHDINSKDNQLETLKAKISELGSEQTGDSTEADSKNKTNEGLKDLEEKLRVVIEERNYFKNQLLKSEIVLTNELDEAKMKYKQLQDELVKCEKMRQDTSDICTILSTRLEELAHFLDSLLKQKSVLGFLGNKENDKIRQLVNESLDISRTFTMSMTLNPDQSLMQLSSLTTYLNATRNDSVTIEEVSEEENAVFSVVPANLTLTYQSCLHKLDESRHEKIINVLRSQVVDLKKEIELRDIEIVKLTTEKISSGFLETVRNDEELVNALIAIKPDAPGNKVESPQKIIQILLSDQSKTEKTTPVKTRTENQSESESWSEPDRNVSMARIGLYEDSLKPSTSKRVKTADASTISTEEEEAERQLLKSSSRKSMLNENRKTVLLLNEQISELQNKLKEKDSKLHLVQVAFSDTEKLLCEERRKYEEMKKQRDELAEKIKNAEARLQVAENYEREVDAQLGEYQRMTVELKTSQKVLQDTMEIKNKETQNRINNLEKEKIEAFDRLRQAEQAAEEAKIDVKAAEQKLKLMSEEMFLLEQSIRRDAKHQLEERLRTVEEECELKVKAAEQKSESYIKTLNDTIKDLQTKYEAEYVKRCEVDKLKKTIRELEQLRHVLNVAEDKISHLEEVEAQLRQQLHENEQDYQSRLDTLRQELEKINLLYSEALLDKSRIMNERTQMDMQLKEFAQKEGEFVRQVDEYKVDFGNMQEVLQKQVMFLEGEKSKLEVKNSELEQSNADLKNRLIKLQSGDQLILAKSVPSSPTSRILDMFLSKTHPLRTMSMYSRQLSDQSGYTSEEITGECSVPNLNEIVRRSLQDQQVENAELERQQSNSSPDLGIESDQGRFSSLEANVNVARPILETLELTESMSNLLNQDDNKSISCSNEQCCTKTKEMVNENNDLRKRLLRTRRALEETVSQLAIANQRKKQVEKTICKQIHKTSQVLRKAKANLDSGSENEVNAPSKID